MIASSGFSDLRMNLQEIFENEDEFGKLMRGLVLTHDIQAAEGDDPDDVELYLEWFVCKLEAQGFHFPYDGTVSRSDGTVTPHGYRLMHNMIAAFMRMEKIDPVTREEDPFQDGIYIPPRGIKQIRANAERDRAIAQQDQPPFLPN